MIVYHGSNVEIDEILLEKCNKYKDFGQGFYTTLLENQAERMARRTVRRFGGTPVVTVFELDEQKLSEVNYKVFRRVDNDWAMFIMNNRDKKFVDVHSELSNHDNKYDVVSGAVANDDIATTFSLFRDGIIDSQILTKRLEYKEFSNQYSFHTPKAVGLLKKTGVIKYE